MHQRVGGFRIACLALAIVWAGCGGGAKGGGAGSGGSGGAGSGGSGGMGNGGSGGAGPQLLWPLASSVVHSRRPPLATRSAAASIEVCADRACTQRLATIAGGGATGPDSDLPLGRAFYRAVTADGATGPSWPFVIGGGGPGRLDAGIPFLDVDGDGWPDLAFGRTLTIFRSAGSPLTPASPSVTLPGFRFVGAAGDVDGDGFGDLVVQAGDEGSPVAVLLGSATGIDAQSPQLPLSDAFLPLMQGVGDVNGDGRADVIAADDAGGDGHVYLSDDTAPVHTGVTLPGQNFYPASGGDLDEDHFADVVQVCAHDRYCVLFGGAPPLARTAEVVLPTGWYVANGLRSAPAAGAGDVNGDGHPDLAAFLAGDDPNIGWTSMTMMRLQIVLGGPSPAPGGAVDVGTYDGGDWQLDPVDDLNGDGYADIFTATSSLQIWFGSADGLRATPQALTLPGIFHLTNTVDSVAGGVDYDGDGRPDLAIFSSESATNGQLFLFHGGPGGLRDADAPTIFNPAP